MPKNSSPLAEHLESKGAKSPSWSGESVWAGPEDKGKNGGISFSLLTRYLTCKERFRLQVVEGLRPAPSFNAPLDFGSMWHICEEAHLTKPGDWMKPLFEFTRKLQQSYPNQQPQILHWYDVCKTLFPIYIEHYRTWPKRKNHLREEVFHVKYALPSGRSVYLKGKWDSVDELDKKFWVWENKTKSSVNVVQLSTQLTCDLQTLFYVVAFGSFIGNPGKVAGVVYNVIRRSAHKTPESMVKKLEEDSATGRIEEWFWRKEIPLTQEQIKKFRLETFDPILEELCIWWDAIKANGGKPAWSSHHFRRPYFRNILEEGGATDLDFLLDTGNQVGLVRTDNLFPELEE